MSFPAQQQPHPLPGPWLLEDVGLTITQGLWGQQDREIVGIDKVLCYGSKEEEACCVIQGHTGKHLGQSGGRGNGESRGKSLYCGLHGKEQVRHVSGRSTG